MNPLCLLIALALLAASPSPSASVAVANQNGTVSSPMVKTGGMIRQLVLSVTDDFSQLVNKMMDKNLESGKTATGKTGRSFVRTGKNAAFSFFNFDATKLRKTASFMNFEINHGGSTGNPPTGNPPTGNPPTGNPTTGNPPTGNPPSSGCPNVRIESASGDTANGSAQCLAECPTGYELKDATTKVCTACPAGSSKSSAGNQRCTPCAAGTYSSVGAATCAKCSAGSYSGPGATSCTSCPAGSSSGAGAAECEKCKAGFTSSAGAAACAPCPSGSFADQVGRTACSKCPAGSSSGPGAAACTKCKAGTFAASAGAQSCTPCPAGQFSDGEGSASCKKCAAGQTSSAGSASCTGCKAGQFASASGGCKDCPPGTYSATAGATKCEVCDLNFALARKSGMDRCDLCPDSGATRSSTSCYKKATPNCERSTNGVQFAQTPKKNCEDSIDNNRKTFGSSGSKAFQIRHRVFRFPTFFRYSFKYPVNLRRVAIWPKEGESTEKLHYIKLIYYPYNTTCLIDKNRGIKSNAGSYLFIDLCVGNKVKAVDVTFWKMVRIFSISEIAFYGE